ncbi:MAG: hypothetical protein H0U86_11500 [Chloroflexi bacterium]|nr:hypothetical protein [Chloroflexota bacterium]
MATLELRVRDWTYRAARRRMVRAGGVELAHHTGRARLDERGNRIVDCSCGWTGNGLGWSGHLDHIVHRALDAKPGA